MTFKRVLYFLIFYFFSASVFSYQLQIKRNDVDDDTSTASRGQLLAFEVLKASLTHNNISFEFGQYGLLASDGNGGYSDSFKIAGVDLQYGGTDGPFVVLWPREPPSGSDHDCPCDYAIFACFMKKRPADYQGANLWYMYMDCGVVTLRKWLGDDWNANHSLQHVIYEPNISNTMPVYVSDDLSAMRYFQTAVRVLNISSSGASSNISLLQYGGLYEFTNSLGEITKYISGSTFSNWSGPVTFSVRTGQNIYQDALPWQLQGFNANYNQPDHPRPGPNFPNGGVDTDTGSEPDYSEYYTGHNWLDPQDDWGQPADIGGGSGSGGEVTSFGPQALTGMTSATSSAIENYFGSDSTLDVDAPSSNEVEPDDPDDPNLDGYWMQMVDTSVEENLPSGVGEFQTLVDRLKNPDSRNIPVITLPFTFDLRGFHNGTIIDATNKPQIDFSILKRAPYQTYYENARQIVVIFLCVCLVIYIVTDIFFLKA